MGGTQSKLPFTIHASNVVATKPAPFGFGSELEITSTYVNNYPVPVTLVFRSGFAITVPPNTGNWRQTADFQVHVKYRLGRGVNIDTHRILDAVSESSSVELQALNQSIKESRANIVLSANECTLSYTVKREGVQKHGGGVYVHELDLVMCIGGNVVHHPESPAGRQLRMNESAEASGFRYQIEIVDPHNRFGERFVNVAGKAYRVTTNQFSTKPEGVYLMSTFPDGHERAGEFGVYERLDFDKAEAVLAMFRTASEADVLGNLAEERKRELEDLVHRHKQENLEKEMELNRIKTQLEEQSHRHKSNLVEVESNFKKFSSQLKESEMRAEARQRELDAAQKQIETLRDMRMMHEKERYERRSLDRKDSSEVVKWLPAMVVGLGVLYLKLASGSSS